MGGANKRHEEEKLGTIEPGKLADIVLVQGNPLDDIENTDNVRQVIANGRRFTIEDLLSGKAKDAPHP